MNKKQLKKLGLSQQEVDELKAQCISNMQIARTHKSGKIANWQKNENMYYGKKEASDGTRANVDLARMQEFVHTLWSKIDAPLIFKYTKKKEAQLKRVERFNSLVEQDREYDFWDMKDLVGKKQNIIYGRSIYFYYADSIDGEYKANLVPCDIYDFLVDPKVGGIDIEMAKFLGRYGIEKDRYEIEIGIKDGTYLEDAQMLIDGDGNVDESSTEENNKRNRELGYGLTTDKKTDDKDTFKFWDWFETYKGVRYHLEINNNGKAIVIEKLEDIFPSLLWPVWTWACFPDLTEFWTPSECDYVREPFLVQNVTINQLLDNGEAINKPQRAVDVGAFKNLAELKYRKDGVIRMKPNTDVNKAYQVIKTPGITTSKIVFDIIEGIHEKASGVNAQAKGDADEKGKVGIYEGNQEAMADRFGLLNKSYAFGYKRFAKLYELGVREHLTKKMAVDILGPDGIEVQNISKRDIFKRKDIYGVTVEASNAENTISIIKQKAKMTFIGNNSQNPIQSPKKAYEIGAKIAGFEAEEIKQLQDVREYGTSEIMSEAERDIERLIEGEIFEPNAIANNAYKQRFVDYLQDHQEDMTQEQEDAIIVYIDSIEDVIYRNEVRALNKFKVEKLAEAGASPDTAGVDAEFNNNPQLGEQENGQDKI